MPNPTPPDKPINWPSVIFGIILLVILGCALLYGVCMIMLSGV